MIAIELVYVNKKGGLFLKELTVSRDCTLIQAIELSGILQELSAELADFQSWLDVTALDMSPNHKSWLVGVFSQKKPLNYVLKNGDRIEIYRPLTLDPMNNRKKKARPNGMLRQSQQTRPTINKSV